MANIEKDIDRKKFATITKQVGFNYATITTQILLAPLLVALLTRTLTVSEFGVYSLLLVFVFFSVSALELGLSQFIITKISGMEDREKLRSFFSLLKFEIIFISLALLIFLLSPAGGYFLKINKLSSYATELKISALIIFAATGVRLFVSFFKAIKRINTANFLDMLFNKGWALLLLPAFFAFGGFTLKNVFQVWFLGAIAAFLIAIYELRKEIKEYLVLDKKDYFVRGALYFSIPLILVIISGWFLAMSNRYILNFYTTTAIVGIFAVAFSLMSVITTFCTTVSQVIQPYFTEAFLKKDRHDILINASLKYGLIMVIPAIVMGVVWGDQLILLLSGEQYLNAAPLLITLAPYPLFALIAFVFYQVMIAAEKTVYVGIMYVLGAAVSVLLNFILIPVYGMQGAAIATGTGYGFTALAMAIPGRKHVKIEAGFLKVPRILLASAIIGVLLTFAKPLGIIEITGLLALTGVLYLILIIVFKVLNRKELAILKRAMPRAVYPLLDYLAK